MDGFPIVSCDGFAAAGSAAEEAKPAETPKNDRRLSFGIDFFFSVVIVLSLDGVTHSFSCLKQYKNTAARAGQRTAKSEKSAGF